MKERRDGTWICTDTGLVHQCGPRCSHAVVGTEGTTCSLTGVVIAGPAMVLMRSIPVWSILDHHWSTIVSSSHHHWFIVPRLLSSSSSWNDPCRRHHHRSTIVSSSSHHHWSIVPRLLSSFFVLGSLVSNSLTDTLVVSLLHHHQPPAPHSPTLLLLTHTNFRFIIITRPSKILEALM